MDRRETFDAVILDTVSDWWDEHAGTYSTPERREKDMHRLTLMVRNRTREYTAGAAIYPRAFEVKAVGFVRPETVDNLAHIAITKLLEIEAGERWL